MVEIQRYDVSAWSATGYTIGRPREDEGSRQSAVNRGIPWELRH